MDYGGVAHAEQEVTIRLDRTEQIAVICSTWPGRSIRLERLFGLPTRTTTRDGKILSAFWTVPLAAILIRKGKRQLSPEQRAAASSRLRQLRQAS